MLRITGGFRKLKVDKDKFTKALSKAIEKQVIEAAKVFIETVKENVPVYTGTALGSMLPAADALNIDLGIQPIAERKGMGPEVGRSMGQYELVNTLTTDGRIFVRIETTVPHFIKNENGEYGRPPWQAFSRGRVAYREYLREHLYDEVPKVSDFTIRTTPKGFN